MSILRELLNIPPPVDFLSYSPSELFRFFFQIGRWTEDSFSADFQTYTRGKLISTVTVNKWKNRDVIPTRYSGPLFKMIEDQFEPDIAKNWITAFETIWAAHIAKPVKSGAMKENRNFSDIICRQHAAWIITQYEKKLSGNLFSASDIYVPLQLIERGKPDDALYDIEDLQSIFSDPTGMNDKLDWTLISGGPGSGKSMAALHLAHELSQTELFPIYIRGSHLSEIDIDIQNPNQPVIDSFSIKSFLQHFRSSSKKLACLILDGIDEIAGTATGSLPALNQILADLSLEQNVCRAHGKRLHVIALGRPSHIEFASGLVSAVSSKTLEMLGLDGRYLHLAEEKRLGRDLRSEWWGKYLSATGTKADPSLPDFLCTDYDEYSEFGSEPLLTYLICHIALENGQKTVTDTLPHEAVNELTYTKNRNEIYRNIIKHIQSRTALQTGQNLEFQNYLSVLQHIALANWHGGKDRANSLKNIHDTIHDANTKTAFQALNLTSPNMLITAFYYRMSQDAEAADQAALQFTHKTFSEYLVSTLIFDRFEKLITAYNSKKDLDEALLNWSQVAREGAHEPNLADFCQKEAALRYEGFSNVNWNSALTLINKYLAVAPPDVNGLDAITQTQRSASLLLFIWSCLNIERQKQTGNQFNLFKTPDMFSTLMLKQIQLPNGLNLMRNTLTEPWLERPTFLTPSLSALQLDSTDMSQLSFSLGHVQSLSCKQVSFAMTHWSHVKVTASVFHKSIFQHAIIHGNRWLETKLYNCFLQAVKIQLTSFMDCDLTDTIFSQCHFSDVEFISSKMDGVIFDRCTFVNCNFDAPIRSNEAKDTTFRYCSFLDMEMTLNKLANDTFEHCIFQTTDQQNSGVKKKSYLEFQLGELI